MLDAFTLVCLGGAAGAPFVDHEAKQMAAPNSGIRRLGRRNEVVRLMANITLEKPLHERFRMAHDVTLLSADAPVPLGGPLPLPGTFSWADHKGTSYLADTYNQHIPQ